jgi:circadian clock protein KaiC
MERVSTGISGFDESLSGGYPRGRSILLVGEPGSGKTTFGIQFLLDGVVNHNENGVLVTLMEESKEELFQNAAGFGYDLAKYETDRSLCVLDLSPVRVVVDREMTYAIPGEESVLGERGFHVGELISLINKNIMEVNAKRVVIDSITPFMLSRKDRFEVLYDVTTIIRALNASLVTALLTAESLPGLQGMTGIGFESFLTDGIILLRIMKDSENLRKRYIEIIKMRGSPHTLEPIEYQITSKGLEVVTR